MCLPFIYLNEILKALNIVSTTIKIIKKRRKIFGWLPHVIRCFLADWITILKHFSFFLVLTKDVKLFWQHLFTRYLDSRDAWQMLQSRKHLVLQSHNIHRYHKTTLAHEILLLMSFHVCYDGVNTNVLIMFTLDMDKWGWPRGVHS